MIRFFYPCTIQFGFGIFLYFCTTFQTVDLTPGKMDLVGVELFYFLFKICAFILFSGLLALPFLPLKIKPLITVFTVLLISVITSYIAVCSFSSEGIEIIVNGGAVFGGIPLRIDALSAWFILLINFTSITGVLYGAGYLKSSTAKPEIVSFHWILYLIFHSSMLLVVIVQHGVAFIVAWELMSLSSLLLVLWDYTNPRVLKAGITYLVQMHISVVLITAAFILIYIKTGTFDFKGIGIFFNTNVNIWLFLIFFAGFGIKAGFFGLHTWLPQAHPAAPSHISGVMSGVIVKMGIYGIFRIIACLKADYIILGEIVLTISLITGLFGIMNAAVHRDFKKMLAYCTIENIGLIGIGIGLGLIGIGRGQNILIFFGFGGALLHVLNHSLFKSLLFFSAGSVYLQTHTRDMDKLGGLIKSMPKTSFLFLAGALAIGGIPPLNGFISEYLIYSGILSGIKSNGIAQITLMIVTLAAMSLIGGVSILTFTKTFGTIFLGTPRKEIPHVAEVPFLMLFPQYLIVAYMLAIAFFPGYFINLLGLILNNTFVSLNYVNINDLHLYVATMKSISFATAVFILVVALIFMLRLFITRNTQIIHSSTWGCGYIAPNSRMQYSGKSFSKSFGKLLNFILIEKKGYTEINRHDTFPDSRKYHSFYLDFIEAKIIDPLMYLLLRFINIFQFIQNGKIQAYVIYGIIFILTIFIGTVLNFWH